MELISESRKFIGLTFPIDKNGVIVKLDVVPGRELNKDDYPNTKNLNLYFNEDHWGYKKGSRQKQISMPKLIIFPASRKNVK